MEDLDKLVDKLIEEDNRKELWLLAMEKQNNIDLNKIANYYIDKKDAFNICELICIVPEYLNLDSIFKKIVKTKDKDFMMWILKNGSVKSLVNNKYREALKEACKEQD